MSRLTERCEVDFPVSCNIDDECTGECGRCLFNEKIRKKLKQYEDKQEQGLLIELPVAIGTTVYIIEDECNGNVLDCIGDCGNCASHSRYVDEIDFDYCLIHAWGTRVLLQKPKQKKHWKRWEVRHE